MPKHKHADLIIAWANGAKIEVNHFGKWMDCDPCWIDDSEYRIKPERVYPKTNLTDAELVCIYNNSAKNMSGSLREAVNAGLKRYIDDQEGKE